jgi:hypothetical protein
MLVHLSHVHTHLLHYWILRVALNHSYHAFMSLFSDTHYNLQSEVYVFKVSEL